MLSTSLCRFVLFAGLCVAVIKAASADEPLIDGKPLSAWLEQLKDGDLAQRRAAAFKLALRVNPDCAAAIPNLIECLKDGEKAIVNHACQALGRIGAEAKDSVPSILEAVAAERLPNGAAMVTIKKIGPAARPALSKALTHKNEKIRKLAAAALNDLGPGEDKSSVADLTKALRDKEYGIRRNALSALGKLGPQAKAAVPEIVRLLRNELDADDAGRALAAIGADAVPALLAALKDKDEKLRLNAASTLGSFEKDAKTVHPALLRTFKNDESPEVQGMAARSLGRLKHQTQVVLEAFREVAAKEHVLPSVAHLGIADGIANMGAAGRLGTDILVFEAMFSKRDLPYLRARCLRALGEVGMDFKLDRANGTVDFTPSATPKLMIAHGDLTGQKERVKLIIDPSLPRRIHRQAFKLLVEDAQAGQEDCRKSAGEALRKIDPTGELAKAFAKS